LADFEAHLDQFSRLGWNLAALSTDAPAAATTLKQERQLHFTLLCDPERRAVQAWNLFNSAEHGGIAKPALFAITPDGIIKFRGLGGVMQRASAEGTLQGLAEGGDVKTSPVVPRLGDLAKAFSNQWKG
jgi:peroxiredoxin